MQIEEIEEQLKVIEEILNTPFELEWGDFDLFEWQLNYE